VVSVGELDCEGMPTSLMWFRRDCAHFVRQVFFHHRAFQPVEFVGGVGVGG